MRVAYVKAPFMIELREEEYRPLRSNEILVAVRACGICGTDLQTAATEAKEFTTFGHEVAGIVRETGASVTNVTPGSRVALESSAFCRDCRDCRNGQPDLCKQVITYQWGQDPMGFADCIIAPAELAVPIGDMPFDQATLLEPMGVAMDLVRAAEIKPNDDVLVAGLGPIGLMALRLAVLAGARTVYGAELSDAARRIELAKGYGAHKIILTDQTQLAEVKTPYGGFDKILVTAPPRVIPDTFKIANLGGIVAFLGIQYGPGADITFDANDFHFKKLQLRASYASPALYFPRCIDMLRSGAVDAAPLISHRFPLDGLAGAMTALRDDRAAAVKMVMVQEGEV
jgi:L-iditol 2-dehydrogenase